MQNPIPLRNAVYILTATGLALSPAAFGGTPSWFSPVLFTYTGTIAIVWSVLAVLDSGTRLTPVRLLLLPIAFYAMAVLWSGIQAMLILPAELAHEAWSHLEQFDGHSLSLDAEASQRGVGRLTVYAIVFLVCYHLATVEKRALRLLSVIVLCSSAYALYGVTLELNASSTVFGIPRTFEIGNLSSTFPNRNAFASYAVLGFLSACALLYRRKIRAEDLAADIDRRIIISLRYFVPRNWWVATAMCLLFIAILMSHSRGGLIIIVIAFLIFLGCTGRASQYRLLATLSGMGLITCGMLTFYVAGDQTAKRFDKIGFAAEERLEIDDLSVQAISDRPVLGTGLDTFAQVFPAYRSASIHPKIDFAHNSYLENALEMGVPAAAAFYAALLTLFFLFVRDSFSKRVSSPYAALGISAMSAMAIHGAFDYSIQFPAIAVTGSAVIGIAAAQSFGRQIDPKSTQTPETERRG